MKSYKKAVLRKAAFLLCFIAPLDLTTLQPAEPAQRENCFNEFLCFITIEDNKSAKLLVRNDFAIPIRVSVNVKGHNITPPKAQNNIPLHPGETREAFSITAGVDGKEWRYTWTSELHPGLEQVDHDAGVIYDLPFSSKTPYSISQGPNGSFSHYGVNSNAIDWAMPVGTEILAAREGTVIGYRENSNIGGSSPKYKSEQNYIWVQHSDGTVGQYHHLKKGGVLVEIGDPVRRGQLIGLSGNTGYSSVPHLHFHISGSLEKGDVFQTFPITFVQQ